MNSLLERFEKFIHKLFGWKVPMALPVEFFPHKEGELTWEKWRENAKNKNPVKYFFMETFFEIIRSIAFRIDRVIYFIRCHTFNKYHLLDLRQPKWGYQQYKWGYSDIVQRMIYANFNLLVEYIEKEYDGAESIEKFITDLKGEKDVPPGQIQGLEKALELYKWWKYVLPEMQKEYDAAVHEAVKDRKSPDRDKLNKTWEMEENIENTIDAKLKELIDIRRGMWT